MPADKAWREVRCALAKSANALNRLAAGLSHLARQNMKAELWAILGEAPYDIRQITLGVQQFDCWNSDVPWERTTIARRPH
jgi:hypothetical protein